MHSLQMNIGPLQAAVWTSSLAINGKKMFGIPPLDHQSHKL